ncbi:hypothetical protein TRICI_006527 [Trichomonascus ciferrii]|uniref:GH18 domain-containing protein n=1 Tax=Trichomonascus ciferrii TaxID=44093 RepID=A0A6A1LPZ3_9ASCO|nr:hypothetical protein TRICI_006527 [Trichomonascus ciferrii]
MRLWNRLLFVSILFYVCQLAFAYRPTCKDNIVYYYGNHLSEGGESMSLYDYCDKDYADVFIISSVAAPNDAHGTPLLDLKEGIDGAISYPDSDLKYYPQLSDGIKHCQTLGKEIFLSVSTDTTPIDEHEGSAAEKFANQVWQLFGPNITSEHRPFGSAVVDGFTLTVESRDHLRRRHQSDNLIFAQSLRSEFESDPFRHYRLSASLPCHFLKTELPIMKNLEATFFDMAFITDYDRTCPFSLQQWDEFFGHSHNDHIVMLSGVTSSTSSRGYMNPSSVAQEIKENHMLRHLAGVMVSDATAASGELSSFAKDLRVEIGTECHSSIDEPTAIPEEVLDKNLFVSITNQFNRIVSPFRKRNDLNGNSDAEDGHPSPTSASENSCECETASGTASTTASVPDVTPTDGVFCLPNGLQLCPTGVPLSERSTYWECEESHWIRRPCGEGTICQQLTWDHIVCGHNITPPVSSPAATSSEPLISLTSISSCPFPNTTFSGTSLTETSPATLPTTATSVPTSPTITSVSLPTPTTSGSTCTPTIPIPSPTGSSPSEGESCPCDGIQLCPENVEQDRGYWECVNGAWMHWPCAPGTVCKQHNSEEITCGFPGTTTLPQSTCTNTTASISSPTGSSSSSVCPVPSASPTEGDSCSTHGLQSCPIYLPLDERTRYWECINGQWLYRPCAPGTVCSQRYCDRIVCDFAENALP